MSTVGAVTIPPAHAWDWVGRQRLVWAEARRRLARAAADAADRARPADVPDWSELLARGPVRRPVGPTAPAAVALTPPDWAALATRAEVMAALRAGYALDPAVRTAVDGAVVDVAFLGRRGGDLAALGIRTPPRGLCWWWAHLGGSAGEPVPATPQAVGVQLTLVDVMTGYGDPATAG